VLDQFVFGYYGATALEAAACGRPVVMRIRPEHYAPLYEGDVAPVVNVTDPDGLVPALLGLIEHPDRREALGREHRDWLVRTHGRARTVPLMLALLRLAADEVSLPKELVSPLEDPLSEEELDYHRACRPPDPNNPPAAPPPRGLRRLGGRCRRAAFRLFGRKAA
jgi:hypothetical protein